MRLIQIYGEERRRDTLSYYHNRKVSGKNVKLTVGLFFVVWCVLPFLCLFCHIAIYVLKGDQVRNCQWMKTRMEVKGERNKMKERVRKGE